MSKTSPEEVIVLATKLRHGKIGDLKKSDLNKVYNHLNQYAALLRLLTKFGIL